MTTKSFVNEINELLNTDEKQFEFPNKSSLAAFLKGFRDKHPGDFDGDVWTMIRSKNKKPVEIIVNYGTTVVDRSALIEILNVLAAEINDVLKIKFGEEARLHEMFEDTSTSEDEPRPRLGRLLSRLLRFVKGH